MNEEPVLPVLITDRLRLRPWEDRDLEPFAAMNADPKVMEFFPACLDRAESDALARRIVAGFVERGYGLWAVEVPQVAAFIGFIGLSVPRFEAHFTPCVEIGWRLAAPFWGQGYAVEGAQVALAFGFLDGGMEEIVSFTAATNQRSRRVMERLGMTHAPADDFPHPALPDDHPLKPHVLYRLRSADWSM